MKFWPKGLYSMRGALGCCHLLVDDRGKAVLLDAGLFGEGWQLPWLLQRLGLKPGDVEAILLTHGHLDHTGNLDGWRRLTGASIWAHPAERAHVAGTYEYQGVTVWCGRLEALGRGLLAYQPARVNRDLEDGMELPFWGGLKVVHLPGHTAGHCGFYSAKNGVMFTGDLFASQLFSARVPPPILNSHPDLIPASLERVLELDAKGLVPNHYDFRDAAVHRQRFNRLVRKVSRRPR